MSGKGDEESRSIKEGGNKASSVEGPKSGSASEEELENLREALRKKEEEARQNFDRFVRERAELENFKKRIARERIEAVRFANESLLRDLLPVVDNLERAVEHAEGGGNGRPLVEGVTLVLKALLEALERHGVRRISALGEPFDPGKHEAMAQVESPGHEPNTVVEEHHKGYFLHERLLRPALVSVAKLPAEEEKKEEQEIEKGGKDG